MRPSPLRVNQDAPDRAEAIEAASIGQRLDRRLLSFRHEMRAADHSDGEADTLPANVPRETIGNITMMTEPQKRI
jgi:hypothetical protein